MASVTPSLSPPPTARAAKFYEVFVDRYCTLAAGPDGAMCAWRQEEMSHKANEDGVFHGGCAAAVAARCAQHIWSLSATHVLLTPFMWAQHGHGYSWTDAHRIHYSLGYGETAPRNAYYQPTTDEQLDRWVRRRIAFSESAPELPANAAELCVGEDEQADLSALKADFAFYRDYIVKPFRECGLGVVVDLVLNHASVAHPAAARALAGSERYRAWFDHKADGGLMCFINADWSQIPKFCFPDDEGGNCRRDTEQYRYILSAIRLAIRAGVSGLRFDHVIGPRLSFWRAIVEDVRREKPDVILIGELNWIGATDDSNLPAIDPAVHDHIRAYRSAGTPEDRAGAVRSAVGLYNGLFDYVFDFTAYERLPRCVYDLVLAQRAGHLDNALADEKAGATFLGRVNDIDCIAFLDNHDVNGIVWRCRQESHDQQLTAAEVASAASALMSAARQRRIATLVYAGDEVMDTDRQKSDRDAPDLYDEAVRLHMNWAAVHDPQRQRLFFTD
eukprot:m51a1_g3376 hypothetical protein (502) ;mRNA; r:472984-474489